MTIAIDSKPVPTSPRRAPAPPTVELCGLSFAAVTEEGCIRQVLAELDAGRGGWVVTPNLDIVRRCVRDPSIRALVAGASLRVADGMPLIWASRLRGTPLPGRVTGSNLVSSLTAAAGAVGRSVYLLGGDPGTAEAAGEVLRQRYPGLRVAGSHCPPFGFESDPVEFDALIAAVVGARPDIIYVALGSPKQERLIEQLRGRLPHAWWIGVGISFSFLCGRVRRAPRWLQVMGLEWLHRLFQEPRRLARRYLVEGIPFALWLLGRSALDRVGGFRRPRRN